MQEQFSMICLHTWPEGNKQSWPTNCRPLCLSSLGWRRPLWIFFEVWVCVCVCGAVYLCICTLACVFLRFTVCTVICQYLSKVTRMSCPALLFARNKWYCLIGGTCLQAIKPPVSHKSSNILASARLQKRVKIPTRSPATILLPGVWTCSPNLGDRRLFAVGLSLVDFPRCYQCIISCICLCRGLEREKTKPGK